MLTRKNVILFIIYTAFLAICSVDSTTQGTPVQQVSVNFENRILGENTKTEGEGHSGSSFSRMTSSSNFGAGYSFVIPDSLKGHQIKITIDAWIRSNLSQSKAAIIISSSRQDSVLNWNPLWASSSIIEPNKWSHYKASIILPKKFNDIQYSKVSVYGFLGGDAGTEAFDIDDFNITFTLAD
jgi:hypothetical protein